MGKDVRRSMDGGIVIVVIAFFFLFVIDLFDFLSYAPWCPACKQFTPIWSDFAKSMEPKQVKVAAIDVDQYPSLSGRFGISALPSVY